VFHVCVATSFLTPSFCNVPINYHNCLSRLGVKNKMPDGLLCHPTLIQLRTLWCILECILQDEQAMRQGCVAIFYSIGPKVPVDQIAFRKAGRIALNFPIRWDVMHCCSSPTPAQRFVALACELYESHTRRQLKCHFGTCQ
jgi:hypothetical protein